VRVVRAGDRGDHGGERLARGAIVEVRAKSQRARLAAEVGDVDTASAQVIPNRGVRDGFPRRQVDALSVAPHTLDFFIVAR
jgi:hypothetical protein